jgi:DNA-binding HxlR family transcriptional regulator
LKEWLLRGIIHGKQIIHLRKEPHMKETTRKRKKAIRGMQEAYGKQWVIEQMYQIFAKGKQGFDALMKEIGKMVAETIRSSKSGH